MDRYASSLGRSLGAKLPTIFERTRPLGMADPNQAKAPMAKFMDAHLKTMAAPSSGFTSAMRNAMGAGYDSIASLFGQPGSFGAMAGGAFTNTGAIASGNLANAQSYINEAASRNGVPPNLLAAFIARESTGNWGRDGNRYVYLPERGYNILPYTGMTDPAMRRVGIDPRSAIGNQGLQIEAAARLIRDLYEDVGQQHGWRGVINTYYSGDPTGGFTPSDSFQYGTTNSYTRDVMNFWNILEPGGPSSAGGLAGGASSLGAGAADAISTMLGGQQPRYSQEFGLTEFAKGHLNGMYSYATSLGTQGHAGVDISLNPGTPTYSPVSGTVIVAGGTGYYTDERYGKFHPTSGELRIKLDNGDEVILGHMGRINVQPGQRIAAGMQVGLSGTYNGGHIHLEYRRSTPGATSSGYTAVDPRTALGGAFTGGPVDNFMSQPTRGLLGTQFADPARLVFDQGFRSQFG